MTDATATAPAFPSPTPSSIAGSTTATAEKVAVACRGLKKTYGAGATAVHALRGVDLDARYGELLMLVGPSGCGKTTLISVVAGILNQDEGKCVVLGTDLLGLGNRKKTRFRGEHIGFIFQQYNLIPTLTLRENVSVPMLINGHGRRAGYERADELLEQVGLKDKINKYPAELSGGQQQRVAIARALVHKPRMVVCDEPTSALDHQSGQKIMALLRDVAVAGDRALIIVTHDPRIYAHADRIAEMEDGAITRVVTSVEELEHR